jgi:hypothetical protein
MYQYALFFHVLGAMSMACAVTFIITCTELMRHATTRQEAARWARLASRVDFFMPGFALLLLIPALYMVITAWGWNHAWIDVTLTIFLILVPLGPLVIARRIEAIYRQAESETSVAISPALRSRIETFSLWATMDFFTALLLSAFFMMTVKPQLPLALAVPVIAGIAGLVFAYLVHRPAEKPAAITEAQHS